MPIQREDAESVRTEVTWALLLRSVLLIQLVLLVATFAVPLVSRDTEPRDADPERTYRLVSGLRWYLSARPSSFGSDDDPVGVPFGVSLTRVVLVVLIGALVLAVVATAGLAFEWSGRVTPVLAWLSAGVLVLAVLLLAGAQRSLSDSSTAYPLQPGLLVPVLAAVWLVSVTVAKSRVDGLGDGWSTGR